MNSQTSLTVADYIAVAPEIFLLGMACLILIVDLFLTDKNRNITYLLSQGSLVVAAVLVYWLHGKGATLALYGAVVSDAMSDVLKVTVAIVTAGVFLFSRDHLIKNGLFKGEFFVLGLFGVI